jgi:hypothetical protein
MHIMIGPKRDEMTRGWIKLHNEEHCNSHFSPNIITMVKSRRMRCIMYVACIRMIKGTKF